MSSLTLETLSIRVNGEHRRVNGGLSVAQMLNEMGIDPLRVAVERIARRYGARLPAPPIDTRAIA